MSKKLMAAASIVIAAVLVGSLVYAWVLSDDGSSGTLEAVITPNPAEVPAGLSVTLSVEILLDDEPVDADAEVTIEWTVEPSALATLSLVQQRNASFIAGTEQGNGTIICEVLVAGKHDTASADLSVLAAVLDQVLVSPEYVFLLVNSTESYEATAMDSAGAVMTEATFEWNVSGLGPEDYELNSTSGPTVEFTAKREGTVTLGVIAEAGGRSASADATGEVVRRTVTYRWYDMFAVPFGEWWDDRWYAYHNQLALTDQYPYLYQSYDLNPEGYESTIHSSMRLNISASGIETMNTNVEPMLLPMFGSERGGQVEIDWFLTYNGTYPFAYSVESLPTRSTFCWVSDGWLTQLTGTVTMDRQAALGIMNMTNAEFNDFESWWASNMQNFTQSYSYWLEDQGNNDTKYDIYCMYEYYLTIVKFELEAQKVGEHIVLEYDIRSWGMEALMTRWLHAAFMPTEWYFENLSLHATIGPYCASLDIETVVVNAVFATESHVDAGPCWVWQGFLQDKVPSSLIHPVSDFDPYAPLNYTDRYAGSGTYGMSIPYDYTPGAFNLTEGETLIFEWPGGDQLFLEHGGTGFWNTTNLTGTMTVAHGEPMPSDLGGDRCAIDLVNRTVTFRGPIDFWTWSRDQAAHVFLSDEWARVGLMPYGMPYIEFSPDSGTTLLTAEIAELSEEAVPAPAPDLADESDDGLVAPLDPLIVRARDSGLIEA